MRFVWWLVILNIFHASAYAFVAGEVRPGIIELRSEYKDALVVNHVSVKKRGRHSWIYFCVANKGPRLKQRCFYAKLKKYPNLKNGRTVARVEYSLYPRIQNKYGRVANGPERYLYPVTDLGPLVP